MSGCKKIALKLILFSPSTFFYTFFETPCLVTNKLFDRAKPYSIRKPLERLRNKFVFDIPRRSPGFAILRFPTLAGLSGRATRNKLRDPEVLAAVSVLNSCRRFDLWLFSQESGHRLCSPSSCHSFAKRADSTNKTEEMNG